MRRFKCFLIGAIYSIGGAVSAGEQNQNLELNARISSENVRLQEQVEICAWLRNGNQLRPMTLFGELGWGFSGGLLLKVRNEQGEEVNAKLFDDDQIIPGELGNSEAFVTLQPNHFLGTCRFDLAEDLFRAPGSYILSVTYVSPVPQKYAKGSNFIGMESGPFESNIVHVKVVAN